MTLEKTKPGESWRPQKSSDHNAIARMVDQWQQDGELGTPSQNFLFMRTTDMIKVKNITGGDRKIGDVVQVDATLLTDTNRLNLVFEGSTPNDGMLYGILREPAANEEISNAQIGGICEARVYITDATHQGCSPFKGETILQSSAGGPYRIWWAPPEAPTIAPPSGTNPWEFHSTGEHDCLIMLDSPEGTVIAKTPSGGIPARSATLAGSAACELYTLGQDDILVPMTNASSEPITKPVKNLFAVATAEDAYVIASIETSGNLLLISEDCPSV
jgi:hypothetical protein